ncbi:MAG: efflux RND transporter permease subunit [Gammaproteobacteria bacterium]|nr:efflux RND transporter permease subunit [Gammaproteobacteria bacterium]
MINALINWSICNRVLVLLLTGLLVAAGVQALRDTPVDAIPDLSDVQVIVHTKYAGQAPQVVEDQVTYPLSTAMLSVPAAKTVRGYSFFGDSYVYVLFDDDTDPYWARSRVLEYLSQASAQLPENVRPTLGPDATGVGWVYEYALVDRTGKHDLAQLRSIQDWLLKFELQAVPGVAEVATVGGMVKQYQVVMDPNRLRAYDLTVQQVKRAIQRGNQETGASVVEMAEAEYMVRASGYISGLADLRNIPVTVSDSGTPVLLEDVADIRLGPQLRRGIAELNGEGEVVGGIVVMRFGANAQEVIAAVKQRLDELARNLPDGVEVVETYDRSSLIERAVSTLQEKLLEEILVVVLVCALFLLHFRSSLVVVISLPIGILVAFLIMRLQGINANIMSLGGIAIAIGAMVDAAIVMIENVHKHLEAAADEEGEIDEEQRWARIAAAVSEVGPSLFFSLLIVALSFLPVLVLEAQEGRMFAPLAWTKTWAMAAAAGLSITLVPVLIGYLVRGGIQAEAVNPVNRGLTRAYLPVLRSALQRPAWVVAGFMLLIAISVLPYSRLGTEFMPELDEGDLMYMPTTFPGLSIGEAQQLLQQTDKLIMTVPEVERVFGKIGRAETATDPAPLTMIETTIQLKPREEWRAGLDLERLKQELDDVVDVPGLNNAWVMPIKTRIDMLATGIKTPLGIKVSGPDLDVIQEIGKDIEAALRDLDGTLSVYSERVAGGRYIEVDIDREAAARLGLNIADVQEVIATAVGGMNISESVEGLQRYPINLRYPRAWRDSLSRLRDLPVVAPSGAEIPLSDVASVEVADGPAMIKSENARPAGWVYVDIRGRDLGSYVEAARDRVAERVQLPTGYTLAWSGQYEYMQRAKEKLLLVVPVTLVIIMLLLYLNFRTLRDVALVMVTLPVSVTGGIWLLWLLGYDLSVAAGVGFIALAGIAAETAVIMLVYLRQAWQSRASDDEDSLKAAVLEGAVRRVRPIMMTVSAIIVGLLPIMLGSGTGSEVMRRIAAPMVGGMLTATLLTLILLPACFFLWQRTAMRMTTRMATRPRQTE